MSDVTLRAARPEEYPLLAEIRVRAYVDGGVIPADLPYVRQLRAVERQASDAQLLVAVDGEDTVLGTVTVARHPSPAAEVSREGELEFRMLATAPEARGRGIGEFLVNAVIEQARDLGLERVVISVADDNARAIRLYERLGFQRLAERDWRPLSEILLLGYAFDLDHPRGRSHEWRPTCRDRHRDLQ